MKSADVDQAVPVEQRARSLALEKSYLELVVRMMARLSAASGVEDVVTGLLANLLDVLGGTNIVLYYRFDDAVCEADVYGERRVRPAVESPHVREAFETRQPAEYEGEFSATQLTTAAFTKSYTWVYPLVVGPEIVGVLEMQNLHIGMRGLSRHLPVFFNYAGQILKNEVQSYERLRRAYDELHGAHASLQQEIAVRQRTEEALRHANERLEERVAERTQALALTNAQLQKELSDRLRADAIVTRRNEELAALNRFLRKAASGVGSAVLLDVACRELGAVLQLPCAVAWLTTDAGESAVVASQGLTRDARATGPVLPLAHAVATDVRSLVPWAADTPVADTMAALFPARGMRSGLSLSLRLGGEALGGIALAAPEVRVFGSAELTLAATVRDHIVAAFARARAEQDARRLSAAIEQSPDSVVVTDAAGRIVYVNPAFTTVTGRGREDVLGRNPREFKSGRHDAAFYRQMWDTLLSGETWHGRLVNRTRAGDLFTEDATIVPVRDGGGSVVNYVAMKRDVTVEIAREEQLTHAQRMEGLGQLAGGIAHDFNNLLGVIIMQLEMMELDPDLPTDMAQGIGVIRASANRAARLTSQLLALGRRQTMVLRTQDLNALVSRMRPVLAHALPTSVRLEIDTGPGPLPFAGDAGMIEQVITNLCANARDAMPAGGRLSIVTGAVEFTADVPAGPDARRGHFVWVRVADTGRGLDAGVRAHLFEPFFTTKRLGQGAGLGLATSYGIAVQHGGWIGAESEAGHGSAFTVYLPCAAEEGTEPPPASSTPPTRARILLVEDEAALRRMAVRCLEPAGYEVVGAADAVEALRVWEAASTPFDLLMTDVLLPAGPSGVELTRQLRARDPGLRVIVMSGYTDDLATHGLADAQGMAFLAKPYTLAQLGEVVARVFAAPATMVG